MKLTTLALFVTLAILGGCGQSGPLYIPGDASAVSPPPADTADDDTQDDNDEDDRSQ